MRRTPAARTRILTYFLLGIALPSGLLGYLAFRGIRNDQALLEREQRQQLEIVIETVGRGAEAHVARLEDTLDRLTSGHGATISSELRAELSRFQKADPTVEAVFLLGSDGRAEMVAAGDLPGGASGALARGRRDGDGLANEGGPAIYSEWNVARRLEFRDADLHGALAAYRRVLGAVEGAEARAEILGAIARVQRKAGRFADAAGTYRVLVDEYGSTLGRHGSPWGPAASLELGRVLLDLGDTLAALGRLTDLYRGALSGTWPLAPEQLAFFTGSARELFQEAFQAGTASDHGAWRDTLRSLATDEIRLREREARLGSFLSAVSGLNAPGTAPTRMLLHEGRSAFHVLLRPPAGEPTPYRWGLLLDPDDFARRLLIPLLEQHAGDAGVAWTVRSRDGASIAATAAEGRTWEDRGEPVPTDPSRSETVLSAPLASGFPPWTIELHRPPESLAAALLTSRRGVYLYAFLLLAGILLFGLTLTVRSVTQELRLARMQADFVSTVSHELRSPLTAIRQLTEMLQAGRVPSEERRHRYYDVLLEQSERLSRLVDDVLDFARMDEGRRTFDMKPVDLADAVAAAAVAARRRVAHSGFRVETEIATSLPPVNADAGALSQALGNLIDNAIKYSAASNVVFVRARSMAHEVVIDVEDFGIGLDPEEVGRVFDRFYRGGDPLTRSVKGTGLGLTLVRQIMDAHGGHVEVDSTPGRGSTFRLRLPVAAAGVKAERRRSLHDPEA